MRIRAYEIGTSIVDELAILKAITGYNYEPEITTITNALARLNSLADIPIVLAPMLRADFGGSARNAAVAAALGSKIYVGTGLDGANKKDWWEYDPSTDLWTQKTDFGGTARFVAVAASLGSKIYVGTGNDGANKKDWWLQVYNY